MKMTLKMTNVNFELEFDLIEEACEFINMFMRNNPTASLIKLENLEKRQMLEEAVDTTAKILGINKKDPVFCEAIKIAAEIIGI